MSTGTISQILSTIECPICFHPMRTPIYQCNTGHSICSNCKDSTRKCPSCEDDIGFIRNYALESMVASLFDHSCPWAKYGCQVKLSVTDIEKHKEICEHRVRLCPFCSTCDSIWQGTNVELQDHLVRNHGEFQLLKVEERIRNLFMLPYCHSPQFRFLIVKHNLFYFYQFESGGGTMNQYGVESVGSMENAKNFAYKIRISSEESSRFRKIQFTELCGNHLVPFKVPRSLLDSYPKPTISLEVIEVNPRRNIRFLGRRGTIRRTRLINNDNN